MRCCWSPDLTEVKAMVFRSSMTRTGLENSPYLSSDRAYLEFPQHNYEIWTALASAEIRAAVNTYWRSRFYHRSERRVSQRKQWITSRQGSFGRPLSCSVSILANTLNRFRMVKADEVWETTWHRKASRYRGTIHEIGG